MAKLSSLQGSAIVATTVIAGSLFGAAAHAQTPEDMPANSWLSVPNTKLEDAAVDPAEFPNLEGNGFAMIVDAWNGAVLDTQRSRLVIWGGGHNDYWGNEMYAFDIASLKWSRITDPTLDWNDCGDPNADGTANSRHTYNGMAYLQHVDRMFVSGGSLNCRTGSCGADLTWTFDYAGKTWDDKQPTGTHTTGCENSAAYDPVSKRVYFGDAKGLYAYSYDDNAWSQLNDDNIYGMTSTIDTARGLLVMVGNGDVWAYAIGAQDFTKQVWTTTGGDAFLEDSSPGLAYDPKSDRIVGWNGGPVYALEPESKAFMTYDPPGAPEPTEQGIFGRWRYVPAVNAFILVTATDTDVHFFKLSDGPGGEGGSGGDAGAAGNDGGNSGDGGKGGDAGSGTGGEDGGNGGTAGVSGSGTTGGSSSTAGSGTGANAGTGATPSSGQDSACGCRSVPGNRAGVPAALGVGFAARAARRRRRKAQTAPTG